MKKDKKVIGIALEQKYIDQLNRAAEFQFLTRAGLLRKITIRYLRALFKEENNENKNN